MLTFNDGIVTFLNGIFEVVSKVVSPTGIVLILLSSSLFWFFLLEVDEMNRIGSKPDVERF